MSTFDTGADCTTIDAKFVRDFPDVGDAHSNRWWELADGKVIKEVKRVCLDVTIEGFTYSVSPVIVLERCPSGVLLGRNFMKGAGVKVGYSPTGETEIDICGIPIKPVENEWWMRGGPPALGAVCAVQQSVAQRCCRLVQVRVAQKSGDVILAGRQSKDGWTIPDCIVRVRDHVAELPVTNVTDQTVSFKPGELIAAVAEQVRLPSRRVKQVVAAMGPSGEPGPVFWEPASARKFDEAKLQISQQLPSTARKELTALLRNFSSCFTSGGRVGLTTKAVHKIDTGDARPFKSAPYRSSFHGRRQLKTLTDEMRAEGTVVPSKSPWSSPVVLVPKKNGEVRFCVDYRRLNRLTKKDVYPLPRIDDSLDQLAGASYFSIIDLKSGYWQVPMDQEDREKAAFCTPDGLFEFTCMPFGLTGAPATFQRLMDEVLAAHKWHECMVYLDDILVFGRTLEEHNQRLAKILARLREANLSLSLEKCRFGEREVEFLGHVVSADGISPAPGLVSAVRDWPVPTDLRAVQSFLGTANFYRRFIRDFSSLAEPLLQLQRKTEVKDGSGKKITGKQRPFVRFEWTDERQRSFDRLKAALCDAPVLVHYDEAAELTVHVDASGVGLGAVLSQCTGDDWMPVSFISKSLSNAERNYHANELECFAALWAVKSFRPYLEGRRFTLYTDSEAVRWLRETPHSNPKFARYIIGLEAFDFEIARVPGKDNVVADALSRQSMAWLGPATEQSLPRIAVVRPKNEWPKMDDAEMAASQRKDELLVRIRHALTSRPPKGVSYESQRAQFALVNDVLYKKNPKDTGRRYLLCLPKNKTLAVMKRMHDHPESGHTGRDKMLTMLRDRFWWPRQASEVRDYVRTCDHCQRHAAVTTSREGMLHPVPVPRRPCQQWGLDFKGPLKGPYKFWLIAVDYTTKWVEGRPVKGATGEGVLSFLQEQIIWRHGYPARIITDNGSAFVSIKLEMQLRAWGIEQSRISPTHAQSNGLVERMNRTLKERMSPYLEGEAANWHQHFDEAVWGVNHTVQSSTGFSPFALLYGREPVLRLDLAFNWPEERLWRYQASRHRATQIRKLAFEKCKEAQVKYKEYYDRFRKEPTVYKVGDLVLLKRLLKRVGHTWTFTENWLGPLRVREVSSHDSYLLATLKKDRGVFGADRLVTAPACLLRRWHQRAEVFQTEDGVLSEEEDEHWTDAPDGDDMSDTQ